MVRRDSAVLDRHEIDSARRNFIQEAGALMFARLKAAIAGFNDGVFVEAYILDAKTARKIPKKMIGPRAVAQRGQPAIGLSVLTADLREGSRTDRRAFRSGEAAGELFRVGGYRT